MPTQSRRFKKSDTHSREKQTKLLKDKLDPKDIADMLVGKEERAIEADTVLPDSVESRRDKSLITIKKIRGGIMVEQKIEYSFGPKKPILQVELRLTTAARGKRKNDGLIEAAYLLRLELISTSANVKIEGFQLGPWNGETLNLDQGSMILCEPLWTAFQPATTTIKGRLLIKDLSRQRVIDIPWKTEAVIPGFEPYSG